MQLLYNCIKKEIIYMKKFTALILAAGLLLDMLCIGASAEGYGRNPHYNTITAQSDYIYYYGGNAIWAKNLVNGKKRTVCKTDMSDEEYVTDICVMSNCLYYAACWSHSDYGADKVYKVDIGSGKQTKIYECPPNITLDGIITAGNRIYIMLDRLIHPEVPDDYYIEVYSADEEFLKKLDLLYLSDKFIDAVNCEVCTDVREYFVEYGENGYNEWYTYHIARIKSDFTEEKITIPAELFRNVEEFVYCDEKYVYYKDKSNRLCRYNAETKKYAVLVRDGVIGAKYKDGAIYFLTEKGDLKKYKKGRVSTVKESPDCDFDAYFFDDYIVYEYKDRHGVIGYDGKELADS